MGNDEKAGRTNTWRSIAAMARNVPQVRHQGRYGLECLERRQLLSGVTFNPTDYAAYANPRSVIAADFNGDGRPDLAIRNNGQHVSVMLNDGNGAFFPRVDYFVGRGDFTTKVQPGSILLVAGDFNGDGWIDLASANYNDRTVSILINKGRGDFAYSVDYATGIGGASSIAASDFNGDGRPDLAVSQQSGKSISVLLNNGAGNFSDAHLYPANSEATILLASDLNNDGRTDLLNLGGYLYAFLYNDHDLGFVANYFEQLPIFGSATSAVTDDFNKDGLVDFAAMMTDGTLLLILQRQDGSFWNAVSYRRGNSILAPLFITSGDFNADSIPDIAISDLGKRIIGVLLNNGDGTFPQHVDYSSSFSSEVAPGAIAPADFNADGRMDLALVNSDAYTVRVLLNTTGTPFLSGDSNRDGVIDFKDLVIVAQNYGKNGEDWVSGDVTGDRIVGFADLVAVAQNYTVESPVVSAPAVTAQLKAVPPLKSKRSGVAPRLTIAVKPSTRVPSRIFAIKPLPTKRIAPELLR